MTSCSAESYTIDNFLIKQRTVSVRHPRRAVPLYRHNQAILTAFFTASVLAFMVIYLEVSRLLLPAKVISIRDLRHLTQGFANDVHGGSQDTLSSPLLSYSRHKPSAIVIGFKDCGAEHLLDLMALHPDVFVNRRDLRFFEGNHTEQWYISRMPLTLHHHLTVDVSLNYVTNPVALQSIKKFDENIRIIVIICNPVTRLLLSTVSQFIRDKRPKPPNESLISTNTSNTQNKSDQSKRKTFQEPKYYHREKLKNDTDTVQSGRRRDGGDKIIKRSVSFDQTNFSVNLTDTALLKNETLNIKNIKKLLSYLKAKIIINDHKGNRTYHTRLLYQNGDFISHISKVYSMFSKKQVYVVDMDRLHSKLGEWSHLLSFLHVKFDNFPLKTIHPDGEGRDMNDRNVSSDNNIMLRAMTLYKRLRLEDDALFRDLNEFYTPYNTKLFSYLNKLKLS